MVKQLWLGKHSVCCRVTWLILHLFIEHQCVESCSKKKWFLCTSFSPLPHRNSLCVFGRDSRAHLPVAFEEGQVCRRAGVLGGTVAEELCRQLLHQAGESQLSTGGEGGCAGWGGLG